MIDFIHRCWKGVLTIVGTLAVITALTGFYSTLATSADIQKVRDETKQVVSELRKSMELDRDISRLNQTTDSLMKARIQQRQYPLDKDITEDVKTLQADKERLQRKIEGR